MRLPEVSPEKVVLSIGSWSSTCMACGRGADPKEKHHVTVLQYAPNPPRGCGRAFTAVRSEYMGEEAEAAVRAMRPDLPFQSFDQA